MHIVTSLDLFSVVTFNHGIIHSQSLLEKKFHGNTLLENWVHQASQYPFAIRDVHLKKHTPVSSRSGY